MISYYCVMYDIKMYTNVFLFSVIKYIEASESHTETILCYKNELNI